MRKRTLGVVLLSGLAFSGASAFTAANNVAAIDSGTENVAGYGEATVSGATVLAIDYVQDTADSSLVDTVRFVADGDLTGKDASLRLVSGSTQVVSTTCTGAPTTVGTVGGVVTVLGDTLFSCTVTDEPVSGFDGVGITVNN